jgi:hypothetical protein
MFVTFNLHFKISINKLELIQSTGKDTILVKRQMIDN